MVSVMTATLSDNRIIYVGVVGYIRLNTVTYGLIRLNDVKYILTYEYNKYMQYSFVHLSQCNVMVCVEQTTDLLPVE